MRPPLLTEEIQMMLHTAAASQTKLPASSNARIYLTPQKLSERWERRIKVKTLANWRSDPDGRGPRFRRHGGRILYDITDVEVWEANCSFVSTRHYGKAA
jgi:hypothetical protein